MPKSIEQARFEDMELDLSDVDVNKLDLDEDAKLSLNILEEQLRDEEITLKGRASVDLQYLFVKI